MRLLGLLCIGLVVGGGVAAYAEVNPFVGPGVGDAALYQSIVDGRLQPGSSELSKRVVLVDCLDVGRSFFAQVQSAARREALLDRCDDLAAGIAASSPSYTFGWYVAAAMAAARGDAFKLNERLVRSQRTGRYEQWVAEQRVQLGEENLTLLDDAARAGHDADLAMLVQSQRGIASIARRYIGAAAFRERITGIVEALPMEDQRRFLAEIQRLARDLGA
jgi:hypothetical protein